MREKEVLEELKLSLEIENDLSDDLLKSIIKRTTSAINSYITEKELPIDLEWILVEAAIIRFSLIGSESKKSETIEGLSNTYKTDPLEDYYPHLDLWCLENKSSGNKSNKVRFL